MKKWAVDLNAHAQYELAIWIFNLGQGKYWANAYPTNAYQYSTYKKYKYAQCNCIKCNSNRIDWKAVFVLVSAIRSTHLARALLQGVHVEDASVCLGTRAFSNFGWQLGKNNTEVYTIAALAHAPSAVFSNYWVRGVFYSFSSYLALVLFCIYVLSVNNPMWRYTPQRQTLTNSFTNMYVSNVTF